MEPIIPEQLRVEKLDRDTPFKMATPHAHPRFEVYLLAELQGQAHITIGQQVYRLVPDSIVIIDQNIAHQTDFSQAAHHERYLIEIAPSQFTAAAGALIDQPLDLFFAQYTGVYHLDARAAVALRHLFVEVNREFVMHEDRYEQVIRLQLLQIFALLMRFVAQTTPYLGTRGEQATIIPIVRYIVEHYAEPLTLSRLAEHFYLNKSYLSRSFKHCCGVSVHQFINQRRIDKAARYLLLYPQATVAQLAPLCGLQTPQYLSKLFRQNLGLTPTQFRQQHLKTTPDPLQ